jgi:hypothetical protein
LLALRRLSVSVRQRRNPQAGRLRGDDYAVVEDLPIWQEVVTGEERAWQEAERVYPPPGLGGKIDLAAERARTKERYQMVLALAKKYEKEVHAKHSLTEEQWRAIRIEASEKQWPPTLRGSSQRPGRPDARAGPASPLAGRH